MTNHVLLDNITHQHLKIRTGHSVALGDKVGLTGVFPSEFSQLQSEYPIFFKKSSHTGQFECVALFGFDNDENLYLTEQGWDADYIPLSIARQPFLIGFQQTMENGVPRQEPTVHIDLDHPRVSEQDGEPVFLPEGGVTPFLQHMTSVLLTIHQGHEVRERFIEFLTSLNLIEPFQLSLTFGDGSQKTLEGLYTINENVLNELEPQSIAELHANGFLQHIYMMLASIGNVRAMLKRKERQG